MADAELQYFQGLQVTVPDETVQRADETMPVSPETGLVMAITYVQFGFGDVLPVGQGFARLVGMLTSAVDEPPPRALTDPAVDPRFIADFEVRSSRDVDGEIQVYQGFRLQHYFQPAYLLAASRLRLGAFFTSIGAPGDVVVVAGLRYYMTRISREDAVLLARRQGELGRGD